jgi:hypothetical protein
MAIQKKGTDIVCYNIIILWKLKSQSFNYIVFLLWHCTRIVNTAMQYLLLYHLHKSNFYLPLTKWLTLRVQILLRRGVFNTTLCNKVKSCDPYFDHVYGFREPIHFWNCHWIALPLGFWIDCCLSSCEQHFGFWMDQYFGKGEIHVWQGQRPLLPSCWLGATARQVSY